jgi:hypothetical protein
VADELGVDARLADAAGNQLRVLAAEIDDEDGTILRKRFRNRQPDDVSADSSAPPS